MSKDKQIGDVLGLLVRRDELQSRIAENEARTIRVYSPSNPNPPNAIDDFVRGQLWQQLKNDRAELASIERSLRSLQVDAAAREVIA